MGLLVLNQCISLNILLITFMLHHLKTESIDIQFTYDTGVTITWRDENKSI